MIRNNQHNVKPTMTPEMDFLRFESRFPGMMDFVVVLARDYRAGLIDSWSVLERRVRDFFSPDRLSEMDAVAPGWRLLSGFDGFQREGQRYHIPLQPPPPVFILLHILTRLETADR
jgi:hypothetical protein